MREASISRKTNETDINVKIELDGSGKYDIDTGIGFFDHMLSLMSRHGLINMKVAAKGDLYVDSHHTIEDIGIVIGKCIHEALGDKEKIRRYSTVFLPMDEVLCMVSMDISGRPYIVFDAKFDEERVGEMDTGMVEEFFRAVAFNAGITLHIKELYGKNSHHIIEAMFKAFGKALREAAELDEKIEGIMSTKGTL